MTGQSEGPQEASWHHRRHARVSPWLWIRWAIRKAARKRLSLV